MVVTKFPGEEVSILANIRNNSNIDYTFNIGMSIGHQDIQWYNDYTDGLGEYVEITIPAGSTNPISRTLAMPDDVNATDVWITVKDPETLEEYASKIFSDVLLLAQINVDIVSVDIL